MLQRKLQKTYLKKFTENELTPVDCSELLFIYKYRISNIIIYNYSNELKIQMFNAKKLKFSNMMDQHFFRPCL